MAPLKKKTIIDYIVRQATRGKFLGDVRDNKAPPITLENFTEETLRYGAKALRTRLSSLSRLQLLQEGMAAVEHIEYAEAQQIASRGQAERAVRDERERANRRQLKAAMAAKLNDSQSVDDLVAKFAGPHLNQHPTWKDHRCADKIEPRLNEALRAKGRRPLKQDAIRKRVKKYRTHAR